MQVQMRQGVSTATVPVQMRQGRAPRRWRCGRGHAVCETTTQSRFGAPRPPGKFPRGLAPRDLSGPLQWDPPVVSKS